MGCYNCKYLKISDKKDGALNGSVYYCTKMKKYVSGTSNGCDSFYKDYSRKTYESDEIYRNGIHYSDDTTPIGTYLVLVIILGIMAIIVNVF
jgi:hypothetical protein